MKARSLLLARFTALLCLCLGINALESLMFSAITLPVPGVKLGLSNLVILFAVGKNERFTPWVLMFARSFLSALLFGNPSTFFFSLLGGILSVGAMQVTAMLLKHGFTFLTVSVAGSLFFQLGQLLAAIILYGIGIVYYAPVLLLSGLITGALIGIVQNCLFVRLKRF